MPLLRSCLLLLIFLLLSAHTHAWQPIKPQHGDLTCHRNGGRCRLPTTSTIHQPSTTTATSTALYAGGSVESFVKNLDVVLLNAIIDPSTAAASSTTATTGSGSSTSDPLVLLASFVAVFALLGLALTTSVDDDIEIAGMTIGPDGTINNNNSSSTDATISIFNMGRDTSAENEADEIAAMEKVSATAASSSSSDSQVTASEISAPVSSPVDADNIIGNTTNETEVAIINRALTMHSTEPRIEDDLTKEGDRALQAYEEADEFNLRKTLSSLIGKVRSTGESLKQEQSLRETKESELKLVGEEVRELEDKYELEQNTVVRRTKELARTKEDLLSTQSALEKTSRSLQVLEDEQKSLRKLGKRAWQLSKTRVEGRWKKIRGKKVDDDDADGN